MCNDCVVAELVTNVFEKLKALDDEQELYVKVENAANIDDLLSLLEQNDVKRKHALKVGQRPK